MQHFGILLIVQKTDTRPRPQRLFHKSHNFVMCDLIKTDSRHDKMWKRLGGIHFYQQSNLYKMTTLGTLQKWSYYTGVTFTSISTNEMSGLSFAQPIHRNGKPTFIQCTLIKCPMCKMAVLDSFLLWERICSCFLSSYYDSLSESYFDRVTENFFLVSNIQFNTMVAKFIPQTINTKKL